MATQDDKPRRPFEELRNAEPQPFHKTPEFQRIFWLCGLLIVCGLFALYSLQSLPAPAPPPAAEAPAAPLSPDELEQRQIELGTRFAGALLDTENGQGFLETSGYRHLIEQVASFQAEELRGRTRPLIDPASVMREPDRWRGEYVRMRAVPSAIWAVKLRQPVAGIHDVWRGVLIAEEETSRRTPDDVLYEAVVVDFVGPPPRFEARRDAVEIEGVLYRTVGYESERGRPVVAPYLIGRSMTVIQGTQEEHSFFRDHTLMLLIGLAVVFGLGRLLMYVFHRRSRAEPRPAMRPAATDFHSMFENVRREGSRSGPGPPARPPPRDS